MQKKILGNAKKHGERAGIYATHVMEDTDQSWRGGAQSFLKESCFGSIDSPSSLDFTFTQRVQRNLGLTATESSSVGRVGYVRTPSTSHATMIRRQSGS
ncbi:hypothetical protein AB9M62_05925 [Bacillales bacterium AN1005]